MKNQRMIYLFIFIFQAFFHAQSTSAFAPNPYEFLEKDFTDFVLLGDTGKANEGQRIVTDSIAKVCRGLEKCDAAVLLGDNIYHRGMKSADDPIIDRVFADFYNSLGFPFYVALGNHDYGVMGRQWKKGAFQLEYAKRNPLFVLPDYFYYKEFKNVVLVVLDTNRLMWGRAIASQAKMVKEAYELAKRTNKWFIVSGHHPYLSNGEHGNAGHYDRVRIPYFASGTFVKYFVDKYVCGKADLYLSGHDHSIQFTDGMIKNCATYTVVSGAGAGGGDDLATNRNPVDYQTNEAGFVHLTTTPNRLELKLYNGKSDVVYTKDITK